MTVLFHGNFGLNRQRMAGILSSGLNDSNLKDKDLAKPFGYGAPFSARYRSWLHKCGLAELGLPLRLTPMGEMVFRNDPKLESLTTQWFLHHQLVSDPLRAEAWHFFAKEFLPRFDAFTKDQLLMGLMEKLRSHSEEHFGPGSTLNKTIMKKIIEAYTDEKGLGQLGLIKFENDQFIRRKPKQLGPWKTAASLQTAY